MAGEATQPVHGFRAHVLGVVRVHSHGGVEAGVFFRQAHRRVVCGKIPGSTDDDQGVDAGLLCAGEHVVAVRVELLGLDVAMGVDEAWEAGSHRTPPSLVRRSHRGPAWVIPAKQGVSKRHPREVTTPEIVIPAKAGIQEGWAGEACPFAPSPPLDSRLRGNDDAGFGAMPVPKRDPTTGSRRRRLPFPRSWGRAFRAVGPGVLRGRSRPNRSGARRWREVPEGSGPRRLSPGGRAPAVRR